MCLFMRMFRVRVLLRATPSRIQYYCDAATTLRRKMETDQDNQEHLNRDFMAAAVVSETDGIQLVH